MFLRINKLTFGSSFALSMGMRTLGSILVVLALAPQAASAQKSPAPEGAPIASAEVSGFDIKRLSPGLADDIRRLPGTALNQERLDALAARIEAERPRHVAAARSFVDPDGHVRVVFVVGRAREGDQDENVNTRYVVERAEITGLTDPEIPDSVRDDLQALVDKRLDSDEAQQIEDRLRRTLPRYDINRRIRRGSAPGRIVLIYEAHLNERSRWLRFQPPRSNIVYHSEQGWGSYLDFAIGTRDFRFTPIVAIGNGDDLIEEYSGFGLRFETRKLGSERLGASFEWTEFDQDWETATLDALALDPIARPYEERSTITPLLKFAFTPELTLSAGVAISELEALAPATGSEMANAAIASIGFDRQWESAGDVTHGVHASFGVRAGMRGLESDLEYRRYFGQGVYQYRWRRQRVLLSAMAGGITGDAPLFERFALGDTRTLRGWDKYDIAPAGGDRVFHASGEYQFRGLSLFLDVGSVWDEDRDNEVRFSAGLGFQGGPAFLTVGIPLNTDNLTAIVSLGLRLTGGIGFQR